jgi:hypothetical protein
MLVDRAGDEIGKAAATGLHAAETADDDQVGTASDRASYAFRSPRQPPGVEPASGRAGSQVPRQGHHVRAWQDHNGKAGVPANGSFARSE